MTITRYCLCGASMQVRSNPPDLAERLAGQFDVRHRGDGCGPTTQAKAAQARRRHDLALIPREDTP
jgi:hypothetical protein